MFDMGGNTEIVKEYVIEFDMNGRITRVNKNMIELTGLAKSEVLGTYLSDFFPDLSKNQSEYMKFWNELRAGRRRDENIWLFAEGRIVSMSGSFVPVFYEGSIEKVICYTIVKPDSTELYCAESRIGAYQKNSYLSLRQN